MDINKKIEIIRYQIAALDGEIALAENRITELKGKQSGLLWTLKVLESDD